MERPDVLGYTLSEARTMLEHAGIRLENIRITQPPRSKLEMPEDSFRVLKCIAEGDESIELIVAKPL